MYENAELIELGAADEVILGVSMIGVDLDTRDFPEQYEFLEDRWSPGAGDQRA
jgi:hypothetical protein